MRALDEIAVAVREVGASRFLQIRPEQHLAQLLAPLTPARWAEFQSALGIRLRDLEGTPPKPPAGQSTVWEVARVMARTLGECQPPEFQTVDEWRDAQVFVGVRRILADSICWDETDILRQHRLGEDLGMV